MPITEFKDSALHKQQQNFRKNNDITRGTI